MIPDTAPSPPGGSRREKGVTNSSGPKLSTESALILSPPRVRVTSESPTAALAGDLSCSGAFGGDGIWGGNHLLWAELNSSSSAQAGPGPSKPFPAPAEPPPPVLGHFWRTEGPRNGFSPGQGECLGLTAPLSAHGYLLALLPPPSLIPRCPWNDKFPLTPAGLGSCPCSP